MSAGVALVEVPYAIGDERHPASRGAERLVEAGAERALAARGLAMTVARVERGAPFADSASASLAVNKGVARAVADAMAAGRLPIVLAGSCDVALGALAGFDHGRCGVVWLDAHADFNTPESTVSGFFPGMSAAVIAGHCYASFWAQVGNSTPVAEDAIVMLGVRDLSPEAERERLERSGIEVVPWQDGRPSGNVRASLDALRARVAEVYVHVDLDALDPDAAPGIVDAPVPGGLSPEDAEDVLRAVAERFRVRAVALTTYNPALDEDEKTLRTALRLIDVVGECAA
ncbi:MAG TPA: arginase family protein [Gaiellaceae bacterium]|nr:arginase family protein [Gaiellaceae bacterium]